MAFPYTQEQSATLDEMMGDALNNWAKTKPALEVYEKRKKRTHFGLFFRRPVLLGNEGNSQAFANYDILSTVPANSIRATKYEYKNRRVAMMISGDEWLDNQGAPGKLDLMQTKIKNMIRELQDNLSDDLFGNADGISGDALGLRRVCLNNTSDCGGIDSNDDADWAANNDATSTAPGLQVIQRVIHKCRVRGAQKQNQVIFTTPLIFDNLSADVLGTNVLRVADKNRVDMGFGELAVLGVPIIADDHAPGTGAGTDDSHLFVVDLEAHEYHVHPQMDMQKQDWTKVIHDQNVILWDVRHKFQWACVRRWSQGSLSTLDPGE